MSRASSNSWRSADDMTVDTGLARTVYEICGASALDASCALSSSCLTVSRAGLPTLPSWSATKPDAAARCEGCRVMPKARLTCGVIPRCEAGALGAGLAKRGRPYGDGLGEGLTVLCAIVHGVPAGMTMISRNVFPAFYEPNP